MVNQNLYRVFTTLTFAFILSLVIGYIVPSANIALAHAGLESSNPAEQTKISQIPQKVTATFTEGLEAAFSSMTVVDADGNDVTAGKSSVVNKKKMEVPLKPNLSSGRYTVKWVTLSVDGHKEKGNFFFTYNGTSAEKGQQNNESDSNVSKITDNNSTKAAAVNTSDTPFNGGGMIWLYILIGIVIIVAVVFVVRRSRRG